MNKRGQFKIINLIRPLTVLLLFIASFYGFAQINENPENEVSLPSRQEIREKILGKQKEDVLKILGKPDITHDGNINSRGLKASSMWQYSDKNIDAITGKKDMMLIFFDQNDSVIAVDFHTSPSELLKGLKPISK